MYVIVNHDRPSEEVTIRASYRELASLIVALENEVKQRKSLGLDNTLEEYLSLSSQLKNPEKEVQLSDSFEWISPKKNKIH